jgi:hypothetical protein
MNETPNRVTEHLSNERTFLAWVRTSISVIVFGFVVAKFGVTLRQFFRRGHLAGDSRDLALPIHPTPDRAGQVSPGEHNHLHRRRSHGNSRRHARFLPARHNRQPLTFAFLGMTQVVRLRSIFA